MDVNGTKFHLLQQKIEDWGECFPQGKDEPLFSLWEKQEETDVEYDDANFLRLRELTFLFRQFSLRANASSSNMKFEQRRGAASDQFGNIYWIDNAGTGIMLQASKANHAIQYWTSTVSQTAPPVQGPFHPLSTPPPPVRLFGLTVTLHHYLVVGYIQPKTAVDTITNDDIDHSGVLIFDLYQNNLPEQRKWPPLEKESEKVPPPFFPRDITRAENGGVYILDWNFPEDDSNKIDGRLWSLDRHFRIQGKPLTKTEVEFLPISDPKTSSTEVVEFTSVMLADLKPAFFPVSIDSDADGRVFVLDKGSGTTDPTLENSTASDWYPSSILVYRPDAQGKYSLVQRLILRMRISDPQIEQGRIVRVTGHDFVYIPQKADADTSDPDPCDPQMARFYVADEAGNQVIAFNVNWAELDKATQIGSVENILIDGQPDYIPLRRWDGRALVYNLNNQQIYYDFVDRSTDRWIPIQTFDSREFARRAVITTPTEFEPGQTFDSTILGCVWHRILIDAEIPPATRILFRARASDDQDLLQYVPWEDQPAPYLRTDGSELPYYQHPSLKPPEAPQLVTEDAPPAGTWELLFQSVKGRYLQLEITLEGTGRSTPKIYALRVWYPRFSYLSHYLPAIYSEDKLQADFLDRWLANFEGFFTNLEDKIQNLPRLLDPRSAPIDALDWLAGWMGLILDPLWGEKQRRFFIRHVHEFYQRRGTRLGLELTLRLYLNKEDFDETTFWTDTSYHQFLRIEELCIRRDLPDFTDPYVHRFIILVPPDTTTDQAVMIDRIANLEKPAHTLFQLQGNTNRFVVGEALLGTDTQLGIGLRGTYDPILLGSTRLLHGYLAASYPLDVTDRLVIDRDHLDDLPEL